MSDLPAQMNGMASRWQSYEISFKAATDWRIFLEILVVSANNQKTPQSPPDQQTRQRNKDSPPTPP